jgi:hypothetical protein
VKLEVFPRLNWINQCNSDAGDAEEAHHKFLSIDPLLMTEFHSLKIAGNAGCD